LNYIARALVHFQLCSAKFLLQCAQISLQYSIINQVEGPRGLKVRSEQSDSQHSAAHASSQLLAQHEQNV